MAANESSFIYMREYWTGDSRDGCLVNGDGYHYYRMSGEGFIFEAYEYYETDDGREVAAPLPEMQNVDWVKDLGFEDMEALDKIDETEFLRVRTLTESPKSKR
ncbi:MAG: hypothetical protein RIQ81_1398 [Pseudomonadota bacterium]|jgi:hypothetical protein